jgi:hypothetical protein
METRNLNPPAAEKNSSQNKNQQVFFNEPNRVLKPQIMFEGPAGGGISRLSL